MGVALFTRVD